ncbi:FAD-dependent monooxygenase [Rickettsiella endosymbiont of Dermanyssus gallinae]|uniref:FAD-dependent monooxygenase n=1 Tax=Rickettsiella endosymbiont of Dermanyssus gallinae TaxID=2856608 RepID=UPI001C52CF92|nr:FAD-dependent monooxygenase [Rickettsiella endosymbiont of Dermanyssus gallinae]
MIHEDGELNGNAAENSSAKRIDTEVLIIGAGPTGLMMACQLLRFGVSFRTLDKQKDRALESRAFAIQAKSMEIFQNLGLSSEFLKVARTGIDFAFFINEKKQAAISFAKFPQQNTPFPSIYFLPQTETERILIEFLEKKNIFIEREKELVTFSQDKNTVNVKIKNCLTGEIQEICCAYIVGCDGAHSTVPHTLNFSFEGAAYKQSFILADATIEWRFSSDKFLFFLRKHGIFVHIPLTKTFSRIMLARRADPSSQGKLSTPSITEIEIAAHNITQTPVKLINPIWLSQFYLHHRGVQTYCQKRAFLAGDAAHIHSPVGGQGMNTGIQDATNLAWKLALVLKKRTSKQLLMSYETERHRIGKILLKTTDRFFSFMTAKNYLVSLLRNLFLPFFIRFVFAKKHAEQRLFWFMSQLNIHYHSNEFIYEITKNANTAFKKGPHAGYRAPDAPINASSLFSMLRDKPFHLLLFQRGKTQQADLENLKLLAYSYADWVHIHPFQASPDNEVLFQRYGVTSAAIYIIRPDGYIGFRAYGYDLTAANNYLKRLFGK